MEYYTEMKMNELLLQATTCMNFTHTILSKIIQVQKNSIHT